jgi:predicted benzoate:H+ symporter BenE
MNSVSVFNIVSSVVIGLFAYVAIAGRVYRSIRRAMLDDHWDEGAVVMVAVLWPCALLLKVLSHALAVPWRLGARKPSNLPKAKVERP